MHLERDLWLLLHAVSPKEADGWIADKLDALDDPEFQAIYLAYDAAFDLPPDDPGLPALAERARRWYTARYQADRIRRRRRPGHHPARRRLGRCVISGVDPTRRTRSIRRR